MRELFPAVKVESKGNNTGLRKAVEKIDFKEDQYYILMDTAVDNPDVLRENRKLDAIIAGKNNVQPYDCIPLNMAYCHLNCWNNGCLPKRTN